MGISKLFGIYHGSTRHKLIHRRTQFERLAKRIGVPLEVLRRNYEDNWSHHLLPNEFCRYVAMGEVSPDGKEFID